MKTRSKRLLSVTLSLLMLLMSFPLTAVSAADSSSETAYSDCVLFDANELLAACGRGEVITERENGYVPVLRLTSTKACKSSYPAFYFNKGSLGITSTGDNSLFDYSHYVIRYVTSGDARTSDTVNLRGNNPDPAYNKGFEKYGGTDQVTKSDTYTIKTIARDTYTGGTVAGVLCDKSWTGQYMTLKIFEDSVTDGYIDIDFIVLCPSAEAAASFVTAYNNGDIERDYPIPEKSPIDAEYTKINDTLTSTVLTGDATYFSAIDLVDNNFISFTGDITRTVKTDDDGNEYLSLSVPAGTYDNSAAYFSIAAQKFDFNVVDYKYMKLVYSADYTKTMDISINPYKNSTFSGETWLKSGSNPVATAGKETSYIIDLTNLGAKTEITSDYTSFNLVIKILGSATKTIDSGATFNLKYIAFFKSEAEASNYTPSATGYALSDLSNYKIEDVESELDKYDPEYFDAKISVSSSVKEADVVLPNTLFTILKNGGYKFNVECGVAKVSFGKALISELATIGTDITLNFDFGTKNVKVSLSDEDGAIETDNKARIKYDVATGGDNSVVATLDGVIASDSGIIIGNPAVNTTLPAKVSYKTNQSLTFDDTTSHWAEDYIDFTTARSLYKGVNEIEFAPDNSMTRSMIATVLMRLANSSKTYSTSSYSDVTDGAWYANAVEWAAQNGIADVTSGKFRPDEAITREELAVFIANYAEYAGLDLKSASTLTFTDKKEITNTDAVGFCVANGIINGYPDMSFKPDAGATRAEVSAMISRLIKASVRANEIDYEDYKDVSFDESNIVLSFASMSDIHIDSTSRDRATLNYENALNTAYSLSKTGDIDLLFAAGDLTQNITYNPTVDTNGDGVIDQADNTHLYEIDAFKQHTDSFLRDDTYLLFTTGNHDRSGTLSYEDYFYNAFTSTDEDIERYYRYDVVKDCDYEKGNRHAVINGFHFLSVGMYQDTVAYLKPLLEEITAEDPYTPIFVQYHFHAADTVYSTYYAGGEGQSDLRKLLDNYPQVVFFSGHTHNSLVNPRAIWQGTFTAIDTASVRYLDDNSLINFSVKIPVNATHGEVFEYASEAMLVEVDANNNIRIKAYNTYRGDVVNEFVIAAPNEAGTHLLTYTQERKNYSPAPTFSDDAEFTLTKVNDDKIDVHFTQATHEDVVWYYTITFETDGENAQTFYFTTRYFDKNGMPDSIDCTLCSDAYYTANGDNHAGRGHKLTEGVEYTASLVAYDAWEHASEPITISYTA